MSDLNKFKANDEARGLVLVNPETEEPLLNSKDKPMTIWLYSSDSATFKAIESKIYDKMRTKRNNPKYDVTQSRGLDILARCTTKFENLELDGAELKYSYKVAKDLYKNYPEVKDQVDKFIGDRLNFLAV